jgi:hypothetical protein
LVKKGYLQRKANGVYVVDFRQPADAGKVDDISNILER